MYLWAPEKEGGAGDGPLVSGHGRCVVFTLTQCVNWEVEMRNGWVAWSLEFGPV